MISIPIKHLKAAILACSTRDSRAHLSVVLIESRQGETRTVVADGNIIAVIRQDAVDNTPHGQLILPRQVVADALARRPQRPIVTFQPDPDSGEWIMNDTYRFKSPTSRYPDYRGAFVDQVSGEPGQYNPQMLAQFGKMARALGRDDSHLIVHHNGGDNAMVSIIGVPEFAGAIAPMRETKNMQWPTTPARWVRQ